MGFKFYKEFSVEIFFIEHRDPIFSLIVLFGIVFMVAFLSYIWGLFRSKDEKRTIEKFIKKFDALNILSTEHEELLNKLKLDVTTLGILGSTFVKSGDFEKAISVYLIALQKAKTKSEKEFVLTELGVVYFKAGFLQNSTEVFLKAVEISPRNAVALRFLTMIDEKLKRFDDAKETLNSLAELGADVRAARAYIQANIIINDKNLTINQKTDKILAMSDDFRLLKRMCMQLWLKNGLNLDEFKDYAPLSDVIDVMYHQNRAVNLNDSDYKALFYAKGVIDEPCKIDGFELNVISSLKNAGFERAELGFNYVCNNCKNSFPMHFYRCPICHELGSVKILPYITEKSDENSMPF